MIYLIRHGQTEFNRAQRYQGAGDSPLTELGRAQARAFGRRLAGLVAPETTLIASPLGRARATAEIVRQVAGLAGPIAFDARLAEISMGSWDGRTGPEIEAMKPGFSLGAPPLDWYMRSPDGETYAAFARRLGDWLAEHRDRGQPLVVVSHGVVSRVLRGLYLGLSKDDGLAQSTPQDCCFRLHGGRVERFDCEQEAAA
ncbi:MAG TPA: histidine phosphatase family protein [Caulobacteraceae bacterium]|jgi:probable phosphoglycerate mutase|nr:histidine phosphatase family protein [Caulobacteraceae bacterium]